MSSYHQAIARQVFLEKFQALLHSIHQEKDQTSAINQYIKSYLVLDGESHILGKQIIAYLQQSAQSQKHLVSAKKFGLTWGHATFKEQARNSYVQLSIVAIVFEAIAQTEASLFDEKYGLTIEEIEPLKQALLKNFIKTIMPESRAATTTEGKLLGGIDAKIEEVLPLVKEEATLAKEKDAAMNAKAEIELPNEKQGKKEVKLAPIASSAKEEKKAKKPTSRRESVAAQQDSSWDWRTVGLFAAGAAIVSLAVLSKGRGGPSL